MIDIQVFYLIPSGSPCRTPSKMTIPAWQQKAEAKRAAVFANIPKKWLLPPDILSKISQNSPQNVLNTTCDILSDEEIDITENHDATDLLAKLASRELTSVAVTTAFCKRAAIAQQLTNCLTEIFFDRALERAAQLDSYLEKTGKTVGPFHGLPISVKDSFNIAGIPSTIGFVSYIDNPPASNNAALVSILLDAGAVLYVKTNIPQTLMTPDSHNNVFGRTLNPHRLTLTAGGSSGGEGAIVAMRASPLGVGTDIAGSIRIPALCCGTFGFKPSMGRVPYGGQCSGGRPGAPGFGPSAGPLSHSARDAALFLKTVFNANGTDLDELALAVPWLEPPAGKTTPIRLGLVPEDPVLPLHPPMRRALSTAVEKLAAAGITIVDLSGQMPSFSKASETAFRFFNMDPKRTSFAHIAKSGEPPVPSLKCTYPSGETIPEPVLDEVFELNVARRGYIAAMHKVFVSNRIDALIGPAYQTCALPHDTYTLPAYTVMFNLIDVSPSS